MAVKFTLKESWALPEPGYSGLQCRDSRGPALAGLIEARQLAKALRVKGPEPDGLGGRRGVLGPGRCGSALGVNRACSCSESIGSQAARSRQLSTCTRCVLAQPGAPFEQNSPPFPTWP